MRWLTRRSAARTAAHEIRRPGMAVALVVAAALAASALALVVALATAPAASAASRDHGASFAVRCDFDLTREPPHRLPDDPIVHPGMPGAAHSHDFFGNTSTDAYSTYESMLGKATTCTRLEDTAAYWIPTVSWQDRQGTHVLASNRAVFYYRAGGKDHTKVKPFPANLKVIASHKERVTWRCGRTDNRGGSQSPPVQCDNGELGVRIVFPDCSNGQIDNDDNHRSHMAYSRQIDGKVRCPRSHPRSVPVLTMNVTFPIPTTPGKVTLSSGDASTMHADFWNTWDQDAPFDELTGSGGLRALVEHCINDVPPSKPRPDECRAKERVEPEVSASAGSGDLAWTDPAALVLFPTLP